MESSKRGTKRRIVSYILDWILILLVAGLGGLLYTIRGNSHAFSLQDQTISYPFYPDTVSITVVGIVALIVPAVVTAVLSLLLTPHGLLASSSSGSATASVPWRRKLWEWNAAWLGLGLSCAGAFFVTSALKTTVGKPRPNFLARCDPDTSAAAIKEFTVSGLGSTLQGAPTLVTMGICQNTNQAVVLDGFAAWPSGHSSFAFAGLLYFSLWLCSKFAVAVPSSAARQSLERKEDGKVGIYSYSTWRPEGNKNLRMQVAAPPIYLLTIALIPLGGALYICGSRWADNQHVGWDILAGALIGALFAWLGFRWYHPPIQDLLGISWGPRSRATPFFGGTDAAGEDEEISWRHERLMQNDVELGSV